MRLRVGLGTAAPAARAPAAPRSSRSRSTGSRTSTSATAPAPSIAVYLPAGTQTVMGEVRHRPAGVDRWKNPPTGPLATRWSLLAHPRHGSVRASEDARISLVRRRPRLRRRRLPTSGGPGASSDRGDRGVHPRHPPFRPRLRRRGRALDGGRPQRGHAWGPIDGTGRRAVDLSTRSPPAARRRKGATTGPSSRPAARRPGATFTLVDQDPLVSARRPVVSAA